MTQTPAGGAGGLSDGNDNSSDAQSGTNASIQKASERGEAAPGGAKHGTASSLNSAATTGAKNGQGQRDEASSNDAAPTPPKLGAGGTSDAQDGDSETADVKRGPGKATKAAAALAAVPAAGAAGQVLVLMMFLNWLKGLAMQLLALVGNLWNLAVGLLLAIGKSLVASVMGVGATVSGAVGGAVSATVAGVTSFAAGGLALVVLVASAVVMVGDGANLAQRDTGLERCTVVAQTALDNVDGSNGDVDAATMSNAKTIYSVLSAWGMPDENIAGIIGNWDAESGIDPTSVQGDFDSPQQMTENKKAEARNTANGIGLGQWTAGRNTKLREYATGHGIDWWGIKTQLGFLVSPNEGGNATVVQTMISRSQGSPADAAYYFHDQWERSADTAAMKARRATYANKWMGLFSGWTADKSLADSILAQAGTTVTGADTARADAIRANCLSAGSAGITTSEGGMTLEQAQELIDLYKREGEEFLDSKYGAGGPGDCGYGKADNCVGFDTYFMNKYTTFDQYAVGNGIDQAASIARMTGKTTSKTPTVYSIASGPGTGSAGHVMVILGIQGDQAIIGEAACGTNHAGTRAYTRSVASITDTDWTFTDVADLVAEKNSLDS